MIKERCPQCETYNVTRKIAEGSLKPWTGNAGDKYSFPHYTCDECKFSWTNYEAEEAQTAAFAKVGRDAGGKPFK